MKNIGINNTCKTTHMIAKYMEKQSYEYEIIGELFIYLSYELKIQPHGENKS